VATTFAAVRDILYLYQDAVESYGGIGHNLDTSALRTRWMIGDL